MGRGPFLGRIVRETVHLDLGLLNFHADSPLLEKKQLYSLIIAQVGICVKLKRVNSETL